MTKKLIIALIPLLVILIALGGILVLLPGQSDVYIEQVNTARQLRQSGDYNQAVVYYTKAIEEDNTQIDPYRELADVYHTNLLNTAMAVQVLRQGFEITQSQELKLLLDFYLALNPQSSSDETSKKKGKIKEDIVVNEPVVNAYASYTYSNYKDFTVEKETCNNGVYTVRYRQYKATFEYRNTPEDSQIVNTSLGKPYEGSRPTSIIPDSIKTIFSFDDDKATIDDLKTIGASDIIQSGIDSGLKSKAVSFVYNNCKMVVACNDQGEISDNSDIRLEPEKGEGAKKITVNGQILDVTSNKPVTEETRIAFREGLKNTDGPEVDFCETLDGTYTIDLAPGNYTVEIAAEGYTTENFELYVTDSSNSISKDFLISPELGADEIRFVLEWGSTPTDLDSHLVGTTSKGTDIAVDFTHKEAEESGEKVATLDVDDTDGYGPETITLSKTSGDFSYYIQRFSHDSSIGESGATIKIYEGSSSAPTVVTPPDDVDDVIWNVCDVKNGRIENLNGNQ